MKIQISPWFPVHIKPVYPGVYITRGPELDGIDGVVWYSYWDGCKWYISHFTPTLCMFWYKSKKVSDIQSLAWCGLTKESK